MNPCITNKTLTYLGETLSSLRNLVHLDLNIRAISHSNEKITQQGIYDLASGLSKLSQLETLRLNISELGHFNRYINDQCAVLIAESIGELQELRALELVCEGWGGGSSVISNIGVKSLFSVLESLSKLRSFRINICE